VTLLTGVSWIVAGMPVYDVTTGFLIGTVGSYTSGSTSLTLAANASHAITSGDVLMFGFTPGDLVAGQVAGADIQGIIDLCIVKANEIAALVSYLQTDVITSSQDATLNTLLGTIATAL
jgi:hypothetical protein